MLRSPFGVGSSFRELDRLQREMNELFERMGRSPRLSVAGSYPAMNVWVNADGAIVTAELPGVNAEDLDISVQGNTLTIRGSRAPEELEEGDTYHRQERRYGQFQRTFQLPFEVEAGEVEAGYERGVLHLSLPRSEADKPKRIQIKAS
ncbi:MAG: Hsp20/alpha crystallin family protein [Anaerolineae bacterium]